ncbi:MAG: 4Fe-4S binding protein [bacterium]|nr:4Fe-4S binding protein [bacterium]
MKGSQLIMIWLLPIIVIGGLFYPILGYLVIAMMTSLLLLSYFKRGRFWCWYLCPRGAFLDIVLSRFSAKKHVPKIFTKQWFRWLILIIFISFLTFRIIRTGGNLIAIGAVFVTMCLVTTIIAIVLGIPMKQRAWCTICPMGTLQEKIEKIVAK